MSTETHCPSCGKILRLPDGLARAKVACPACGARFHPIVPADRRDQRAIRGRRSRPKRFDPTLPVVLLVALVISGLVWFFLRNQSAAPPPAPVATPSAPAPSDPGTAPAEDPLHHPAMRTLVRLMQGLRVGNPILFRNQLDLPEWYRRAAPPESPRWTALSTEKQDAFAERLQGRLEADPGLLTFDPAAVDRASASELEDGGVLLLLSRSSDPDRAWEFQLAPAEAGSWLLRAYRVRDLAAERRVATEESARAAAAEAKSAEQRTFVATEGGGRMFRGTIQKVPLPPDTSPATASHIEELIEEALAENGLASRAARRELARLAPSCVPFLLNRLAEVPVDGSPEHTEALAGLDALLQSVSFRTSAFPLASLESGDPALILQKQKQTVESWFGWWAHWGKNWAAWRDASGMPPPEEEPAGRTRHRRGG